MFEMKRNSSVLLTLIILVFSLTACSQEKENIVEEQIKESTATEDLSGETTISDEMEASDIDKETIEQLDDDLFTSFLAGKVEAWDANNDMMYYIADLLEDSEGLYLYFDIDGDGKDELHIRTHKYYSIVKDMEGILAVIYDGSSYEYPIKEENLLGILYYRPGGAPTNEIYQYRVFDSQGEIQDIITFEWYDSNENVSMDEKDLYLLDNEEVSKQNWEEKTRLYRKANVSLEKWQDWSVYPE